MIQLETASVKQRSERGQTVGTSQFIINCKGWRKYSDPHSVKSNFSKTYMNCLKEKYWLHFLTSDKMCPAVMCFRHRVNLLFSLKRMNQLTTRTFVTGNRKVDRFVIHLLAFAPCWFNVANASELTSWLQPAARWASSVDVRHFAVHFKNLNKSKHVLSV